MDSGKGALGKCMKGSYLSPQLSKRTYHETALPKSIAAMHQNASMLSKTWTSERPQ